MTVLLGTQFYAGSADARRRQEQAIDALLRLRDVALVNLQWVDEVYERPEIETLPVLRQDSRTVTRLPVGRKPIMPEVFDALAGAASARGCRYFGFLNADILVSQAAIDVIAREERDGYAFSRRDIEADTGRELGLMLNGLDLFVFADEWWRRERHRFRPYILAEWFYDCVFGALMACHGDGLILNRDGEIRHEAHPRTLSGPLAHYNGYLAALDAPYFSLWVRYSQRLDELRQRGASEADERALQREIFVWRPSWPSLLVHVGRQLKARWRYRRLHGEMVRDLLE
jgi:hypothetical protein